MCKNSEQTTPKSITQPTEDSKFILQKSWGCPLCGKLNDENKKVCDCGYTR